MKSIIFHLVILLKTNKGKVKGTILDYLKVFDRQFVDPATKEPREQGKILRKNFYSKVLNHGFHFERSWFFIINKIIKRKKVYNVKH